MNPNKNYTIDDLGLNNPIDRALNEPVPSFLEGDGSDIISPASIGSGEIQSNVTMQDGFIQSQSFVSGSSGWKFRADGVLEAMGAVLNGAIEALSGVIGGFTITTNSLYGGTIKTSASVGAGVNGVIMDEDGLRGYDATLGQTFNLPTDGTAPSFSSGTIQKTTFEINTNATLRTSSTVGDGTGSSAGILINNTGLYATEASQTLENANVKILVNGSATFNGSVKGGQTDFNTGTGYFIGLSSSEYKFSIGDPTTNYMTWDGTYLKIKGSFDVGSGGIINNATYTVATLPIPITTVGFNSPSANE
jgi:hypothetical protein